MKAHLRAALPPWVATRVVVGFALLTTAIVHAGTRATDPVVGTAEHGGLLSWDAAWFFDIAAHGYGPLPEEGLRFFPVYPLLARLVAPVVGIGAGLVLLANGAALAFTAWLRRLVVDDLGDIDLADRSIWVLALAPTAFVLVMGYSEALAGLAAVVAVWGARRQRWGVAAGAGACAGALRPSGLFLVVPLAIEAVHLLGKADAGERRGRAVAVTAPVLGMLPYLAWVAATRGDWRLPFTVQQADHLRGRFTNPVTNVAHALGHLDGSDIVLGLRGLWALALVALLVVVVRRLPRSYAAYAAVSLAAALATTNLGSLERYAYGAFPFVIGAATLVPRSPRAQPVVFAALAGALACSALLAFVDLYVP